MTDLVNRRPAGFNYSFRPASYFDDLDPRTVLLASINGEHRRKDVENRLETGDFHPAVWGEWLTEPTLDLRTRYLFSSVHPALMSGEYLPSIGEQEIEIARVVLASTMGDVTSIRARRSGNRISYVVVDEYETQFLVSRKTSTQPLTMAELIDLINTTERADGDFPGGPAIAHVVWHIEAGMGENMRGFSTVESTFYPELEDFYETVINGFLDEYEAANCEEEEEAD